MAAQFAAVITNLHRVQVGRPGMSVGPLHSGWLLLTQVDSHENFIDEQMVGHKFNILSTSIKEALKEVATTCF